MPCARRAAATTRTNRATRRLGSAWARASPRSSLRRAYTRPQAVAPNAAIRGQFGCRERRAALARDRVVEQGVVEIEKDRLNLHRGKRLKVRCYITHTLDTEQARQLRKLATSAATPRRHVLDPASSQATARSRSHRRNCTARFPARIGPGRPRARKMRLESRMRASAQFLQSLKIRRCH